MPILVLTFGKKISPIPYLNLSQLIFFYINVIQWLKSKLLRETSLLKSPLLYFSSSKSLVLGEKTSASSITFFSLLYFFFHHISELLLNMSLPEKIVSLFFSIGSIFNKAEHCVGMSPFSLLIIFLHLGFCWMYRAIAML